MKKEKPMIVARYWGIFERVNDFVRLLSDYDWIHDMRKKNAILAELEDPETTRKNVKDLLPTKEEFFKLAKVNFEKYQDYRIEIIKKSLLASSIERKKNNPFIRLLETGKLGSSTFGQFQIQGCVSWPEVASAINRISEHPDSLSQKEKSKVLGHTEKRLKSLNDDLLAVCPKNSRFRQPGVEKSDLRDEWVRVWIEVQSWCDGPVGPRGVHLKYSSEAEKKAHRELGIDVFINSDADCRPYEN